MTIKTRRDDLSTYGIMGCYPMRPGPTLPTTAVLTLQIINYAQSSMGGTILVPLIPTTYTLPFASMNLMDRIIPAAM
jgi:hypothetical protein